MAKKHAPRSGSMAFYPRKHASRETPSFRAFPAMAVDASKGEEGSEGNEGVMALNFLGYKAGMTHVIGKDSHEKGATFGQDINIPVTILETPALKVFGIRAYGKAEKGYGVAALADVFAEKADKELLRKMHNFKKKSEKKAKKPDAKDNKKPETKGGEKKAKTVSDLDGLKEKLVSVSLLAHSQPQLCGFGKKTPDVFELSLSGDTEQQLGYAKEILGKEVKASDIFKELEFIDVKAVTKGKGTQGPVKRFGIRMHRPKAKKRRVVGSIGPWNPSTIMHTVPRPGQMGYHNRTECNKKILMIGSNGDEINPKAGFKGYGNVKSEFVVVAGSIPGPAKRAIALRKHLRKLPGEKHKLEKIDFIASKPKKAQAGFEAEEKLAQKVEVQKEEKKEKKSVADEIKEATGGKEGKPEGAEGKAGEKGSEEKSAGKKDENKGKEEK